MNSIEESFDLDVIKLGGKAIANSLDTILKIIQENQKPKIFVASSIGETTELSEKLIKTDDIQEKTTIINEIRSIYFSFTDSNICNNETKDFLNNEIIEVFAKVIQMIGQSHGNLTPKEKSYVLTRGEYLAALILSKVFEENKINIQFIKAENVISTKRYYTDATIDEKEVKNNIEKIIIPELSRSKNVIIPGLTGVNKNGLVTYLGVNSGDLVAALIAKYCKKHDNKVSITFIKYTKAWQSADRRMVDDPKNIKYISLEETSKSLKLGYELVHPEAIEGLLEINVKVRMFGAIDNTVTNIVENRTDTNANPIVAIVGREIYYLLIKNNYDKGPGYSKTINEIIEKYGGSISYEGGVITSVIKTIQFQHNNDSELKYQINKMKKELSKIARFVSLEQKAEIHIVGNGLCFKPGALVAAVEVLSTNHIKCLSLQGEGSCISIVVPKGKKKTAIRALHQTFF